jgi:hypothetical protein
MAGGSVTFTLDDGETLSVPDEALRPIYDTLWDLAREPGAVSTAALIMDARRLRPFARNPTELTTPQSAVLRKAMALIHA